MSNYFVWCKDIWNREVKKTNADMFPWEVLDEDFDKAVVLARETTIETTSTNIPDFEPELEDIVI